MACKACATVILALSPPSVTPLEVNRLTAHQAVKSGASAVTGASARLCEKALASHGDDIQQAADWLCEQPSVTGADEGSKEARGDAAAAQSEAQGPSESPADTASLIALLDEGNFAFGLVLANAAAGFSRDRKKFV